MANTQQRVRMKHSNGSELNAYNVAGNFDTAWIHLGEADYFGFQVETASSSGTSPVWNIDVEGTVDDGTTVDQTPGQDLASETAMDLPQIAGNAVAPLKFFRNPYPPDVNCKVRLEVTAGGTSPAANFTIWLLTKKIGQ